MTYWTLTSHPRCQPYIPQSKHVLDNINITYPTRQYNMILSTSVLIKTIAKPICIEGEIYMVIKYELRIIVVLEYSSFLLICLAIVIARSLLLLNVAHFSKSIKSINTIHGALAHHDKMQLQDKWHNSDSYSFRVTPFFKQNCKNLK